MKEILEHIQNKLPTGNYLFEKKEDVFFMTRFHSSNLFLLLINDKWYALTDQRYFSVAVTTLKNYKVIDIGQKGWIEEIKSNNPFNKINIDSSFHSVKFFEKIKDVLSKKDINVTAVDFGYLRDIYREEDANRMAKAVQINDLIFEEVRNEVKIGMTEKDVYTMIMIKIIKSDADKESFEPIVASGVNGANPHHHATDNVIKKNDMLTIDMGVFYEGFASDMTRTFVVSGKASIEAEDIWNTVKRTMEQCIEKIKPGTKAKEIHNFAAKLIKDAGYESFFNHGLGHGLGVEIHDEPTLNPMSEDILKEGMTITIEPGIYIPGKYGVRLEQDVIVTKGGYKILQNTPITLYK